MSGTCDNCRRPKAAEYGDDGCERGMPWSDRLRGPADCAAARDRWLVARIATLEAELAEARKPRWSVNDDGWHMLQGQVVWYDGEFQTWCLDERFEFATFLEAKAAAEMACGGEAGDETV